MQNFGYHTHTCFSDGQNTVEEMIDQAIRLGFEEIGISDHLIVHKNIKQMPSYEETKKTAHVCFDEMIDICNRHADEIRRIGKQKGIQTFVGYEADYFTYNGWEEEFRDFAKKIDYDYFISGNHFLMSSSGESIFDIWQFKKYPNCINEKIEIYFRRHFEVMKKAIQSKLFAFLAHIDYAQNIHAYKQADYEKEIDDVVRALKENKTGCEISTKGLRRFGHPYPSESILKKIIQEKIPIVISDDAHSIAELGSYFSEAERILKENNCHNRFQLKNLCL